MEYIRLVKTLRSGRVEAEVTLGQAQGGTWYYNTRLFRPFKDLATGQVKRAYSFGQDDMPHVIELATRAEAWVGQQPARQSDHRHHR